MRQPRKAASVATGRASGPPPNNSRWGGGVTAATNSSTPGGACAAVAPTGNEDPSGNAGVGARDDEREVPLVCVAIAFGHVRERLPLFRRRHARQQDVHGAFAPGAEPEQLIGGAAQVVADDAALAGGGHFARMFAKVAFETTAGQQARVFAVAGDEHLRAGLGVGGAAGPDDRGEDQGLIGQARAVVQRQEAVQGHVAEIYVSLWACCLRA